MRLYLLPISTRRALIYCQRLNKQLSPDTGYINRITSKAAKSWAEWEEAPSGWKKKVTQYGNQAFKRIPYEEWGLKSIPPLSQRRRAEELAGKEKIEVVFPRSVIAAPEVSSVLKTLGTERQALHRRRMWQSLAGLPLTLPVGLIPIIPNLPFFYLAFRGWSHWRALNGSRHVEFLVQQGLLHPRSSPQLDAIYAKRGPNLSNTFRLIQGSSDSPDNFDPEEMLLDETSHRHIAKAVNFPELGMEIERAVQQVQKSIRAAQALKEQEQEVERTKSTSQEMKQKK